MPTLDEFRLQLVLVDTPHSRIARDEVFHLIEPKCKTAVVHISLRTAVILVCGVLIDSEFDLTVLDLLFISQISDRDSLCLCFVDDVTKHPFVAPNLVGDILVAVGVRCIQAFGLEPKFIKCGHHGNNIGDEPTAKPSQMARKLKKNGCLFYWDNDYSTKLTDFLMTGREDAINAGMTIYNIHGDINAIWQRGFCSIYKDYKVRRYKCSYKGETTLKQPNLAVVTGVLRGDYGSENARISKLIDAGFYPISVQEKVNEIVRLVKG